MKKLGLIIIVGAVVILGLVVVSKYKTTPRADNTGADATDAVTGPVETAATEGVVSAPAASRYVSPKYGFSFEKPEGFTVGAVKEGEAGETIVVQPVAAGNGKQGFQIYITPLDAPVDLTPTLIKKELPGTTVGNPQKIVLDEKGKGIMFTSNSEAFGGKSFEIWFATNDTLYQVSSYADFAAQLQQIIGTWKF